MELSNKITYLRKRKGWSQEQLAGKLEVSRQAVYKWEAGISQPEIDKLKRIAKLFDVTFNELLDDEVDITAQASSTANVDTEPCVSCDALDTEPLNTEPFNNDENQDESDPVDIPDMINDEDTSYNDDIGNGGSRKKHTLIIALIFTIMSTLIVGAIAFVLVWHFSVGFGPDNDTDKTQASSLSSSQSSLNSGTTDSTQGSGTSDSTQDSDTADSSGSVGGTDTPKETYYTVLFDTAGGSSVGFALVKEGGLITKELNTVRSGYVLLGWVEAESFEEWDFAADTVNRDMTLVAVWMPSNYVLVTFDRNDGSGEKQEYLIDKTGDIVLEDVFMSETRALFGWSTKPDGEIKYFVNEAVYVEGDTVFYAVWAPENVALIIFDKNDGSHEQTWKYVKKNESVRLDNPFGEDIPLGWSREPYGQIDFELGEKVVPTKNITLYAQWESGNQYEFSQNLDGTYTLEGYYGNEETVIVPAIYNGGVVTHIGDFAFDGCDTVRQVILSEGLTTIGEYSFYGAYYLESLVIPSTVNAISTKAFNTCLSLQNIDVAYANTYYASINGVLYNDALTRLIKYPMGREDGEYFIPDGTHYIEDYAFYSSYLVSVILPDGVGGIGVSAFEGCISLCEIDLGNRIDYVGQRVFYGCALLESVVFEHELYSIGKEAFYGCSSLVHVEIHGDVGAISYHTFGACSSLEYITIIGGTVTGELSEYAFEDSDSFKGINYE